MPNQEYKYINYLCSCCGSNDSDSNTEETVLFDLPEVLAESAKETVVENLRLKAEEAEKLQLESRLENIESILYQLLKKWNPRVYIEWTFSKAWLIKTKLWNTKNTV